MTLRRAADIVLPMAAIVVMTTVGNEEQANLIADEMIVRRHAACVNILPSVRSVYRWGGKICRDSEYLLLIKTVSEEYEAVAETIRELHGYDLPEILAVAIDRGSEDFIEWIESSLDKQAEFSDEQDAGLPLPNSDDTGY